MKKKISKVKMYKTNSSWIVTLIKVKINLRNSMRKCPLLYHKEINTTINICCISKNTTNKLKR